jgi:hypothetical protein
VKHGQAGAVKILAKAGSDSVAYHRWGGYNLLHLAVERGHTSVVKALLGSYPSWSLQPLPIIICDD